MNRYSSQIAIPEIGELGQQKLLKASVLIIGLGGLGCPIALQLVAAGIGKIGLVDGDIISLSNLSRQLLYSEDDIGKSKLEIAFQNLTKINSETKIIRHDCFLNQENTNKILSQYDIVVDASDNFTTRYLINDNCYLLKKPLVTGMVFQFDGQMIFFDFRKEDIPCLRCLHPTFDTQTLSCAVGGVTNMIAGIISSMQANEVLKCIIGLSTDSATYLIKLDSMKNRMKKIKLTKDINCQLCNQKKNIFKVEMMKNNQQNEQKSICTMNEFKKIMSKKIMILDVRNPEELITDGKIPASINIPLANLIDRHDTLNKNDEIIIYCHSGIRSLKAVHILKELGFEKVRSLENGIIGYKRIWISKY